MIYVRHLVLVDENDTVLLNIKKQRAIKALTSAMRIVENKDCRRTVLQIVRNYIKNLDNEFSEYFKLGGENEP